MNEPKNIAAPADSIEELEEKVQAQACKKACMTEAKKDLRC